jgi:hypothetical protein
VSAPYGYRYGDERRILVHVVSPEGWVEGMTVGMCGTGLDREAPWPGEGQKWCRRCTDAQYRYITDSRVWPAGSFRRDP